MLFRCNILALVGGGKNPRFAPNKVMIWDDHQNRCIGELSFRSDVKSVRLRRDRIVVVLEHKLYVYNFADLKLVDQVETISNPKGLCALSASSASNTLACPGLQKGHVHLELYDAKKTTLVAAHETHLSCISLNADGSRLATASEKGTLVRTFDTSNGQLLQELRRGADRAIIYSISFSNDNNWLCVSSDKGTIHVWKLPGADQPPPQTAESPGKSENPKSSLSFMKGLLPKYFSSEWSFAQFRVQDVKTICAFGAEKNSIVVVSANGAFHKCYFDPVQGGECRREVFAQFMEDNE
eukprot:TRINITY_DN1286_c0_g1_i1.p1 TRINITY_DN1286_c0_g1~~TRINITY_DN1286_c0_g1_i1.p1  ORF type:complete len:296 (-),score=48.03 TRINITY_DN1286_c0_g1_i1:75-962(-)